MRSIYSLVLMTVLGACGVAKADTVLYDQPYNTVNGYFSYAGSTQQADNFTLASTATINSIVFYGVYAATAPATDAFTFTIFNAANGLPGTVAATVTATASKTDTGQSLANFYEIYQFATSLPAFTAVGGTDYFLGISSSSTSASFAWSTATGGNGRHAYLAQGASSYNSTVYDLAYTLSDAGGAAATPEPSSLALLGTGVLGMVGAARRRFARQQA